MLWKDKIAMWKNGQYQSYPDTIKHRFFYETFVCDKNMTNKYIEKFIENKQLHTIDKEDYSSFIHQACPQIKRWILYYIYTYKICVVTVVLYTKKLTYLKVF